MRPGEIKIEGLGKRYRFRSDAGNLDSESEHTIADADFESQPEEKDAFSFFRTLSEVWALRDISCHIQPGERVAVVGANGSGKSTLIRILSRTLPPSEGRVSGGGIVLPFAALRSPLSPYESGCDNLRMLARLLGIPLDHLEERLPQIVEFSELGSLANEKVSRYSEQSFARLAIAMGLFVEANIYLIDGALKAGDELYRSKIQHKFADVLRRPVTLIFASNSLEQLRRYCNRALWLDRGRLIEDGHVHPIIDRFLDSSDAASDFEAFAGSPEAEKSGAAPEELLTADETLRTDNPSIAPNSPHRVDLYADTAPEIEVPPPKSKSPRLPPVIISPQYLQPVTSWQEQLARAEDRWQDLLMRWRSKPDRPGAPPLRIVKSAEACVLARIISLSCVNEDYKPVNDVLPGETFSVDLLIETFHKNVVVAVRLEMDTPPTLIFAAEPLVPFTAAEPARYLLRAGIEGWLTGHHMEAARYKLRMRVLLTKADTETKEMAIAKIRINIRGDLRHRFDEWRHNLGEQKTSALDPIPAFINAPESIPGIDEPFEAPGRMSAWTFLNRRPLLRPRLNWTIYQVSEVPVNFGVGSPPLAFEMPLRKRS